MIAARTFAGHRVAVFGLGGSGVVTARSLLAGGAQVAAWDDNPERVAEADRQSIPTTNLRDADWREFDALVLSPGVPLTHPRPHWAVELAIAAGLPIIGDIEVFSREHQESGAPFIAITGTNGKSTTTALIAHILEHSGHDTQMGGNIGRAVLSLEPPQTGRHFVVECSSYQIELAPSLAPDFGILLNISPDHLDRHGTMENYMAIKERLVSKSRHAIIAVDDAHTASIADRLSRAGRRVTAISKDSALNEGYFASGPRLMHAEAGNVRQVGSLEGIGSLRGVHNAQNALAAWAVCTLVGLGQDEIMRGIASFPGLAHRMEQVGRKGKVLFINDSKATNPDAAALAIASFPKVHWIAGGLEKVGGFEALRPHFGHIAKAYLIGEAAASLAAVLGDQVEFEISGTLDAAVQHAERNAAGTMEGESVVLLSPACASFDQFRNFEVRGEAFKKAVKALGGVSAIGGKK